MSDNPTKQEVLKNAKELNDIRNKIVKSFMPGRVFAPELATDEPSSSLETSDTIVPETPQKETSKILSSTPLPFSDTEKSAREVDIQDTREGSVMLGDNTSMFFNKDFDSSELKGDRSKMQNLGPEKLKALKTRLKPRYEEFQNIKAVGVMSDKFEKRKKDLDSRCEF